jgi:hypothetical protein
MMAGLSSLLKSSREALKARFAGRKVEVCNSGVCCKTPKSLYGLLRFAILGFSATKLGA